MSVIKGSIRALKFVNGRLDRATYVSLSETRHGADLGPLERDHYYTLFETYQQLKAHVSSDYDNADFVSHVYHSLAENPNILSESLLDTVFVDEVQDLSTGEISILNFVCKNPKGFFFAGDTAQTIAQGVGFRFEDLKDLFFNEFLGGVKSPSVEMPPIRQLKQNFRTHSGVLKLANTVIRLIYNYFPHSIDVLDDESSLVLGPKPIFLEDTEDVISALFERGSLNICEFGSEQVILVRDDRTKEGLRAKCGDNALVLTVQDSKGMEFTDCLIYNFFSNSGISSNTWRVIGSAYEALGAPAEDGKPFPTFDRVIHSVINAELKKLYVLLTRAKQRLFIFESDLQVRKPMLSFWSHSAIDAVDVKPFDEDMETILKEKSKPSDWCKNGKSFFDRGNFNDARLCFVRGGDKYNECLSTACHYTKEATIARGKSGNQGLTDPIRISLKKEALEFSLKAADIYRDVPLVKILEAAQNYKLGEKYEIAAELFISLKVYIDAAQCYEICGKWMAAATSWLAGDRMKEAINACYLGGLYRETVEYLDNAIDDLSIVESLDKNDQDSSVLSDLRNECIQKASSHYHSTLNINEMMHFVSLMESSKAKTFLTRRKHFKLLIEIEKKGKR
jgi:tetratricopeptide (TPR) repeat protein